MTNLSPCHRAWIALSAGVLSALLLGLAVGACTTAGTAESEMGAGPPRLESAAAEDMAVFDERLAAITQEVEQVKHLLIADAPLIFVDNPLDTDDPDVGSNIDADVVLPDPTEEVVADEADDEADDLAIGDGRLVAFAPRRDCALQIWDRQRSLRTRIGHSFDPAPRAPCPVFAVPFALDSAESMALDTTDQPVPLLFPIAEDFGLPRPPQAEGSVRSIDQPAAAATNGPRPIFGPHILPDASRKGTSQEDIEPQAAVGTPPISDDDGTDDGAADNRTNDDQVGGYTLPALTPASASSRFITLLEGALF